MLSPNSPINPKSPNIAPFIEKSLFSPLHARITESSAQLAKLAGELKTELLGIDDAIDRVIESMRAWHVKGLDHWERKQSGLRATLRRRHQQYRRSKQGGH